MYVLSHSFQELSVKTDYKPYLLGPYSITVADAGADPSRMRPIKSTCFLGREVGGRVRVRGAPRKTRQES